MNDRRKSLMNPIDSRGPQRSTALVTNISFEAWADYLGDPPLAMADPRPPRGGQRHQAEDRGAILPRPRRKAACLTRTLGKSTGEAACKSAR